MEDTRHEHRHSHSFPVGSDSGPVESNEVVIVHAHPGGDQAHHHQDGTFNVEVADPKAKPKPEAKPKPKKSLWWGELKNDLEDDSF